VARPVKPSQVSLAAAHKCFILRRVTPDLHSTKHAPYPRSPTIFTKSDGPQPRRRRQTSARAAACDTSS